MLSILRESPVIFVLSTTLLACSDKLHIVGNILIVKYLNCSDKLDLLINKIETALKSHVIRLERSGVTSIQTKKVNKDILYQAQLIILPIEENASSDYVYRDDIDALVSFSVASRVSIIPIFFGNFDFNTESSSLVDLLIKMPVAFHINDTIAEEIENLLNKITAVVEQQLPNITVAEIKENIESSAPIFIQEAEDRLRSRANDLREKAQSYFVGSYAVIVISIIAAICYYWGNYDDLKNVKDKLVIILLFIRSLVLLTLITAVIKYSFTLGRAYMHEALKLEERIHAISFGKFYLNVYKQGVTPTELKEVFRDWNINQGSTAFLEQKTSDFDPKVLEQLLDVVKAAKGVVGKD